MIWMTKGQIKTIRDHVETCYPEEGCGFLLGHAKNDAEEGKKLTYVESAKNVKDEARKTRYLIDPKEFMQVEQLARKEKLDVLGIYHSHPDHPSAPSEFDRNHAWPWYSYIIVAVEKGRSRKMTSWILTDDRKKFIEEAIREEQNHAN